MAQQTLTCSTHSSESEKEREIMIGGKDSYALVTGASSGIGYELAKLFARDGKNTVVVARSRDKLEELKANLEKEHGTKVRILVKDLSDAEAPQEILSELQREGIDVDVLVNNAGFCVYGPFCETDLQQELEMLQVNVISVIHLTKLFLKRMVEGKSGYILNVASLCAFAPVPLESVYCSGKAGVLHFSEALANELKGSGVSVTCLCPGLAKTLFHKRARMEDARVTKRKMMDAATVAQVGLSDLKKGKVISVPGLQYRLWPLVTRVAPRSLVTRIMRAQHERT
jgi:short-subunit dehydrogenase